LSPSIFFFVNPFFPIEQRNLKLSKIRVSLFLTNIVIFYLYMNFKKIIIYQYDILFNILNEISENLNFEVIKAEKENLSQLKKNLKDDFLVISQSKLTDTKNQLIIDKIPLKINSLIEKINLKFLKEKFNSQSDVSVGPYRLNLNSREIIKKDLTIPLTEREINLILFLKKSPTAVKIDELEKKVWDYSSELETHTVETHIYRLRKKIKEKFKDDNFILSDKNGYLIN